MKIIGCGHPDRGDDAAGLLVISRLRQLGVEACSHSGEALDLIESWSGADSVILVDAVVTGGPPGQILVWNVADAGAAAALRDSARSSTHALGVADALGLARALGRLPAQIFIYGVEGASFDLGTEPSPGVLAAVETAARDIFTFVSDPAAVGKFPPR